MKGENGMIFEVVPNAFRWKFPERILIQQIYLNLGIIGPPEVGKTHYLTNYAFQELYDTKDAVGVWTTAQQILTRIHEGIRADLGLETLIQYYMKPDILLIDDLFASANQMKPPGCDTLLDIFTRRMNDGKRTLWTSNKTENEIMEDCDPRFASRLLSKTRKSLIIEFTDKPLDLEFKEQWSNSRCLFANWSEDQFAAHCFICDVESERSRPFSYSALFRFNQSMQMMTKKAKAIVMSKISIDLWNEICEEINLMYERSKGRTLDLSILQKNNKTETVK